MLEPLFLRRAVPSVRHTHLVRFASTATDAAGTFLATPPAGCLDVDSWARALVAARRGDGTWTVTVEDLRPTDRRVLSTASLVVGQEIEVLVSLGVERSVRATVRWRSGTWFVATSEHAVHRGIVSDRLGGKGPAFVERYASSLSDLPEVLAYAADHCV